VALAKKAVEDTRDEAETHLARLKGLQEAFTNAREEKTRVNREMLQKRDEVLRAERNVQTLQGREQHWMDSYPNRNLPKLMRAIEKENGFRERPVGPMGRHVKLLKQEWSSILEKQSGGSLSAFVVTSKADQDLLSVLMKETNW
jgi:structural maintenance of chromosomes protein 6